MIGRIFCWMMLGLLPAGLVVAQSEREPAALQAWIERQAGLKRVIVEIRQERYLRTVKKPLVSTGKFWFVQEGAFRWEAGSPPKLVALMTPAEELSVIYPAKKTAEIFSKSALERDDAGQGIAFLRAGFPSDQESFRKRFEVIETKVVDGWDVVDVKPRGAGNSFAVRKLVLSINQKTRQLGAMQIHLRDGSWINNTVTGIQENPTIPASVFNYDLAGFEVKRK